MDMPVREVSLLRDFERSLKENWVVVVDFSASWCPPCARMKAVLERVAKDMGDRALFLRVDVDMMDILARRYGVTAIPTIVVLVGGREVARHVGAMREEELKDLLAEHVGTT